METEIKATPLNNLLAPRTRTTGYNSTFAIDGVQCSPDTFVAKIATFAKPENVT